MLDKTKCKKTKQKKRDTCLRRGRVLERERESNSKIRTRRQRQEWKEWAWRQSPSKSTKREQLTCAEAGFFSVCKNHSVKVKRVKEPAWCRAPRLTGTYIRR